MGIITKEVEVLLVNNAKWYEEKGYEIPRRKDKWGRIKIPSHSLIKIKVEDLYPGSDKKIEFACDHCGKILNIVWKDYIKYNHNGNYYCIKCSHNLFGKYNLKKTLLAKSMSFYQWCIDNDHKNILDRWDYELNQCTPNDICYQTEVNYWFKCSQNKHSSELYNIKSFTDNQIKLNCRQCKSMANVYPHLIKYFVNKNDAYNYSYRSHQKLEMKCFNCGYEKLMSPDGLVSRGFGCQKCGDGISFSEKFVYKFLEQLNINFELQKIFDWSKNKRYDFYLPEVNCVIETHGIQHYKELKRSRTLQEEQENDYLKEQLALKNDIKYYIILDCRQSTIDFIRNSIMQSQLVQLFNFKIEDIDWVLCCEFAFNNLVKEVCNLWNDGLNIKQIVSKLKLGRTTVTRYLKQGSKLNWCSYDPKVEMLVRKLVICLNTNKIFNNQVEASKFYNVHHCNISKCCRNQQKYTGRHPETNEPLRWIFYDDYLAMQQNNQIQTQQINQQLA